MRTSKEAWFVLSTVLAALSGCTSSQMMDKEYRTDTLRGMYPAGTTSRVEIQATFGERPSLSQERPEAGWQHHPNAYLSRKLFSLERKTNKEIVLVECYLTPDPRSSLDFHSLCTVWFYYDAEAKVVDVEWEWHTD